MSTIAIPGACNTFYNSGEGFLHHGIQSSPPSPFASYPIYFCLPYDGNITGASISIGNPHNLASYSVRNIDTNQESNNLLSMNSGVSQRADTYGSALSFQSGERILWHSEFNYNIPLDASTVLTTFCTLNTYNIQFIPIICALNNGNIDYPYGFGSGGGLINSTAPQIRIPFNCSLNSIGLTANESGSPISSTFTLDIESNGVPQGQISMLSGNTSATTIFTGPPVTILAGSLITIKNLTLNPAINNSVCIILFEKI